MKTLTAVLFLATLSLRADTVNTFVPAEDPQAQASSGDACTTIESSGNSSANCDQTPGFSEESMGDHHDDWHEGGHGHHGGDPDPMTTPEPSTLMMAGTGIILILHSMRRR